MDFLSQTYIALRGPTGAPQTAAETIAKLSDRLSPDTLLADRRAAVLSLKGLTRDWKEDVGENALPGLLEVLHNDAEIDAEIGKAALETLNTLCEMDENTKDLALRYTEYVLAKEQPTHTLFALLGNSNFYIRYATIQLLTTLLQNRRQVVQGYFLKAPSGASSVIAVLEDKREIIQNESIALIQNLISQSPDIQKVLAFEGAFEKLFHTVTQENGVEGGIVSQDALKCVDGLLRFNTSNQSYFRETTLPSLLCSLLQFPPSLQIQDPVPQEFSLQFWDQQKLINVSLVIGIMGMLISSKGNSAPDSSVFVRCFTELALSSNAPTLLKTQALRLLPDNLTFPLSGVILTPYMPVPETNGEEWDRLEPASALDVLVELAVHGEYNGLYRDKRTTESLELRSAAATVFENFVNKEEIRQAIVQGMAPSEATNIPSISPLLYALCLPPSSPINFANVTSTHFATLLFAQLLSSSSRSKTLARSIKPHTAVPTTPAQGQFFVPADGPPREGAEAEDEDDDDSPQSLLHLFNENLSLAFLSRSRMESNDQEAREWDRLIVAYLCLLSQWLWTDPKAVREFLDTGGLGVLVEPINQTTDAESLIPGLCAFLLGICYEFNRQPGEITRATIHPIINRLGVDMLVGQMNRLREDDRFKAVGPTSIVLPYPTAISLRSGTTVPSETEGEIWFDWAFVDFWKSNQYTIQRGLGTDPNAMSPSAGASAESAMLISSLRDVIRSQAQELEEMQQKIGEASAWQTKLSELQAQVSQLEARLVQTDEKNKELEKEQEDLLVLLDEVSTKRKRDKERLRAAGLDVSEDEGDEGEDVEEDED